jgi:hypothetical protein
VSLHAESALRIPLIAQAMADPHFKLQARGIDAGWKYCAISPMNVAGFNPFLSTYFFPNKSCISKWMKKPEMSIRDLNESDLLMKEILFFAHDYLHSWAYRAIHALVPKLGFGSTAITQTNFEDFVFCHILTEACATVGLDYWYLSTISLNKICDVGTLAKTLTVGYRQENDREYRKFNPELNTQSPDFFEVIARFYCSGVFPGFALEDLQRSPMTMSWIKHELEYGEKQREYARSWFSFLSKDTFSVGALHRPVDTSIPWREKLIRDLGRLLWSQLKENHVYNPESFDSSEVFSGLRTKSPDFRFLNLNLVDSSESFKKILSGKNVARNFRYFFYQYVSNFDYDLFDQELIKLFPLLLKQKDFEQIQRLFRKQKRLSPVSSEPKDLFFIN